MKFFVSIIIPTHNRCDQLIKCLSALKNQSYNPDYFEAIIVADSCTDNTISEVTKFSIDSKFQIKIFKQEFKKASASRNKGISEASGGILLFLDDDVLPETVFVEKHVEAQKNADVVIGYLETILPEKPTQWNLWARLWWESRFNDMALPGHMFNYKDFFTGNVSVKTSFIKTAGVFNESFIRLEDYELGYRLINSSARFFFSRKAKGKHFETNNFNKWAYRLIDEGSAFVHLGNLYPELKENIFKESNKPEILKRIAFNKIIPASIFSRFFMTFAKFFEKIKARNMWRISGGVVSRINYWRGVARNFKNIKEFEKWFAKNLEANYFSYNTYCIDINSNEFDEFNDKDLEFINKNGLRIKYDNIDLYRYTFFPGSEKLRKEHIPFINDENIVFKISDYITTWENLLTIKSNHPIKIYDIDITELLSSVSVEKKYNFLIINLFIKNQIIGNLVFRCDKKKNFSKEEIYSEIQRKYNHYLKQYILIKNLKVFPEPHLVYPSISVMICVEDKQEKMIRCLESMENVEYPDFEVLVYDYSSKENSVDAEIRKYAFTYKKIEGDIKTVWNLAIEESKKEIIIFINENAVVNENWLFDIAKGFNDKNIFSISGLVLPFELETETNLDFEFFNGAAKQYSPFSFDLRSIKNGQKYCLSMWGKENNIAFRKAALKKIMGFALVNSEQTNIQHFDDSSGYSINYKPSAYIKYYHGNDEEKLIAQTNNQRKSFLYFFLVIRNFVSYSPKHLFTVALIYFFINYVFKRIIRSIIKLNPKVLFNILMELVGFIGFYGMYKKLKKDNFENQL